MELREFKSEMTLPLHVSGAVLVVWSWSIDPIRREVVMALMWWQWSSVESLTVTWFVVKTTIDHLRRWEFMPIEPIGIAWLSIEAMVEPLR